MAASLPAGAFSILPVRGENAARFVEDPRIKLISFTGSPSVGWGLKQRAGKKRVLLELGGNAAVIVDADADIDDAVTRIVFGAFYTSGQSCISVQRIYVHETVFDLVAERLVAGVEQLRVGDPLDPDTDVGPMIEPGEADVDGDSALFLLLEAVGVDPGQREDQARFTVVDVARRTGDDVTHGVALTPAPSGRRPAAGPRRP